MADQSAVRVEQYEIFKDNKTGQCQLFEGSYLEGHELNYLFLSFSSIVATLLRNSIGFQLQYQLIFTLWLLSFDPRIAQRMIG